jgi:hypothetical protein
VISAGSSLVRIPRELLHVGLDDLPNLGVAEQSHAALRGLLADLPLVPDATSSAQLVGAPSITLPCLAVLARHIRQGLRDRNLSIAHDRLRLHADRAKLVFLRADALAEVIAHGDNRVAREAVLLAFGAAPMLRPLVHLLELRDAANLATFIATTRRIPALAAWRVVDLATR